MGFGEIRSKIARQFAVLGTPLKIVVIAFICVVVGIVLFWLCNQVIYYYLAKSYADALADAYNLNRGFANAALWASFAAIVGLTGFTFSFSKRKRYAGYVGLLALIIGHSVAIGLADRNFGPDGAQKCYVLTRDSVKILNRVGVDPETGRECRPLTPAMAEKIDLYKIGKRPALITSNDQAFFSPISGEPIVWYAADKSGTIVMFDLMGYHPQTGVELLPVAPEIVQTWKQQRNQIIKRAPERVDPDKYAPFDPLTGAARVWFWRSDAGEYEFFDGPGYEPQVGEPLKPISRDILAERKKALEAAAAARKAAQDKADADNRIKAEQQRVEALAATEAQQKAHDAEVAAAKAQQQAGDDCDRLAANPTDSRRTAGGTPFDQLKGVVDQALDACSRAVQTFPDEQRYMYQLGRALQFKDRKRAFDIFTSLVGLRYPAAYDNLGGMYLYDRKDMATAIKIFAQGVALGDADSMVSLADLVDKGAYGQQNPYQVKWALLNKAAESNHAGAQRAVAAEKSKLDSEQADAENAQRAAAIFGSILGGIARH